jgi:Lrp/AsnC ligand binding domain
VIVFVQVGLARQSADSAQAFGKLIRGMEEVQEAFSLTGEAGYVVKMAVPDLKTPSRTLNDVFLPHRSVAHVRSSVVLDRIKETTRLLLRQLSHARAAKPARSKLARAASRFSLARHSRVSKMSADECADVGERTAAGLQARVPKRPSVNHVRPNLKRYCYIGSAGGGRETSGVGEQGLVRSHLNQCRWEASQISVERRDSRVLPGKPRGEICVANSPR